MVPKWSNLSRLVAALTIGTNTALSGLLLLLLGLFSGKAPSVPKVQPPGRAKKG